MSAVLLSGAATEVSAGPTAGHQFLVTPVNTSPEFRDEDPVLGKDPQHSLPIPGESIRTSATRGPFADGEFFGTPLSGQAELPVVGDYLEFGFDALWTMNGPKLLRIDPSDYTVTAFRIPGATGQVRALIADDNALWIPDLGAQRIFKFDPLARTVPLAIDANMTSRDGSIAVGLGSVWVITDNDRLLERFNAETGERQASIPLPSDAIGTAIGGASVWVTAYRTGELFRIDPATNTIVAKVKLHPGPRFIIAGFGSLWVFSEGDCTLQRVDWRNGQVIASISVAGAPGVWSGIATGGGFVWVTTVGLPLAQINPRNNKLTRQFTAPFAAFPMSYGAGSLWFASNWLVYRIKPPADLP